MKQSEFYLHQLMDDLRMRLLTMAASTQQASENAMAALLEHNSEKAIQVINGDKRIDDMEVELDASILSILARSQPVARDLRLLTSGIRLVVDLERIGDEAELIAQRAILLQDFPALRPQPYLEPMCQRVRTMLAEAVAAFSREDKDLALRVRSQHDQLAECSVLSIQSIMDALQSNAMDAWYAMHMILISRSLERIGSRSINIAEHAYFLVAGVSIKHTPVSRATQQDNGNAPANAGE